LPPVDDNKNVISKNEVFEKTDEQISGKIKDYEIGDQSTVKLITDNKEGEQSSSTVGDDFKGLPTVKTNPLPPLPKIEKIKPIKQNLLTKLFVSIFKIFK
jgi:hypothetical protein